MRKFPSPVPRMLSFPPATPHQSPIVTDWTRIQGAKRDQGETRDVRRLEPQRPVEGTAAAVYTWYDMAVYKKFMPVCDPLLVLFLG